MHGALSPICGSLLHPLMIRKNRGHAVRPLALANKRIPLASVHAVRYTYCLRESAFANVAQLVEQRTRNA